MKYPRSFTLIPYKRLKKHLKVSEKCDIILSVDTCRKKNLKLSMENVAENFRITTSMLRIKKYREKRSMQKKFKIISYITL